MHAFAANNIHLLLFKIKVFKHPIYMKLSILKRSLVNALLLNPDNLCILRHLLQLQLNLIGWEWSNLLNSYHSNISFCVLKLIHNVKVNLARAQDHKVTLSIIHLVDQNWLES